MTKEYILEGKLSIESAIKAKSRRISRIYVDKNKKSRRIKSFISWIDRKGIKIKKVDSEVIDDMTKGKTHGGIIAKVSEKKFLTLENLIEDNNNPFIVMLDGIEDPYNFGYAVRSLYLAGVDGVVVKPRNWMEATSIVAKASAGTTELMPMAIAEDIDYAAEFFSRNGLNIAATAKKDSQSLYDVNLDRPTFLLIGGEKRGITRSFLDKADTIISIPYGRDEGISLAVTSATSIIAFEMMRQKSNKMK
ncbi:23S rRNA (guanosine(2251)-2'-O)-methyltransferase RlmB [Senegalia massiliensis]|uniref:23S rRNA (Guanosine(2251)-2'-O)-methyltransferase RlmB n=1 Tax=Senegalia massiliensis TaxID=1720316 RepID=A0A845QXP7_9CLOT|nr:23S rRNA (guanosine(2251)-2'-O)-methyltransferase RlmB [Senegalia massiliensis]NBI05922.1 23S rRNA (guanosine(2251)-2'-O)-methyltransferase RlmB [Senegalia massiliensis]